MMQSHEIAINDNSKIALSEEQERFKAVVDQVLHDIQSPLSSLHTIIESTKEIPEQKRIALRTAAINIADITHQILNQYKPKDGALISENGRQVIMLSMVLSEILSDRRFRYRDLALDFVYNLTQLNAFLFIKVEPSDLKRAISNLINNAVDALPKKGGKIELSLKANEEWVFIRILDNGLGIPKTILEKIKNNIGVTSKKGDGHGIGLPQVRDMLARNYGNLEIYSTVKTENHGTTIELRFPKVIAPDWVCEEILLYVDDTIVILDDDELIHAAWNARFESIIEKIPTLKIKHCTNGNEAADFIANIVDKNKVCLLSDYELIEEKENGLEIIKKCNIKRGILVTGYYTKAEVRKQALQSRIKILPKELVNAVSLKIEQEQISQANVHMVFVDDEKAFTKNLVAQYYNNLVIDSYGNPFDFLENVTKYSKDTKIILDNYYYTENNETYDIDGITLGKTLHDMGYTRLFLLSGEEFAVPEYLKLILKSDQVQIKILDKL